MRYRGNGGLVGPTLTTNTSYASGFWSLPEFQQKLGSSTWPIDLTSSLITEAYFKYDALLLKAVGSNTQQNYTLLDSSTVASTITRNGDVTQGAFSPYSYSDGRWAAYFDGNGDYLNIASNSAFNLTGDFTIELWFYDDGSSLNYSTMLGNVTGWSSGSFSLRYNNTGLANKVSIHWNPLGDPYLTSSSTIATRTWNHVAFTRSGTTCTLWVNGVSQQVVTTSTALNLSYGGMNIGWSAWDLTQGYFKGNISNVRIVNGTSLYNSPFTVPIAPLSAVSGTSLLTCQDNRFKDNSSNAFSITRNGDAKVSSFGPFNPDSAYTTSISGGSMYFDGSGDYLTASYNTTNFDWWTSDYTIDAWIYPTTLTGWSYNDGTRDVPTLMGNLDTASQTNYWSFGPIAGGTVRMYYYNGTGVAVTSTATISINQWNHIAMTKTSSGITIYVNGVASTTTAVSGTPQSSATYPLTIGRANATAINGYATDIRILKGTALYSASFTPPTTPLTAITNTKLLLSGTNAGIIDASRKHYLYTVGTAAASTTQKKFSTENSISGAASAYILAPASPDLEFGSGDFTIEMWWYPTSTARQALFHGSWGTDCSIAIDYSSVSTNQKIGIWASSTGSSWNLINADPAGNGIGTTSLTQNAWNHIAFVRNGTTWMLFVNGNRDLNLTSISGAVVNRVTSQKAIGAWFSTGSMQQQLGYLQDFRITKGYARYTANFTPTTTAFTTL